MPELQQLSRQSSNKSAAMMSMRSYEDAPAVGDIEEVQ
jgi:hypothetical protein